MKKWMTGAALACLVGPSAFAQNQGPMGYWMTEGGSQNFSRYDAGTLNVYKTSGGADFPIAVSGDVRTAGSGQFSDDHGGQYDLNGNWMGVNYADLAFSPSFDVLGYDGTTDGKSNYFMNYGNQGGVWVANRDWTSPKMLFALGGFGNRLGITYDSKDGSLWTSGWDNGMVEEYDMAGNLLRSWDAGIGSSLTCLALDDTTGTLWMGRQSAQGFFYGFDRNGNRVGSFFDSTLQGLNTLGGEFNVVPEPFSILALGAGLAAIARRRRKN